MTLNRFSSSFAALENRSIEQWFGVEMAFSETDDPEQFPLVWSDPSIPYRQFFEVAVLIEGRWFVIQTEQNDNEWGLGLFERLPNVSLDENSEHGIYRNTELIDLPLGTFEAVTVEFSDAGNIGSLSFKISNARLEFLAGEVYEESLNSFSTRFMDESVLLRTCIVN